MQILTRFKKAKTKEEIKEKIGYNPALLSYIQPQGGVSFHENYIRKGDGYESVITVYEYPTNNNVFWLENIMNLTSTNTIVTVDIATQDKQEARNLVNKGMKEQEDRIESDKNKTDKMDARYNYQDLLELYDTIANDNEVIKQIITRIYVHGQTISEVEDNAKLVFQELEGKGFKAAVFLNEQKQEHMALFLPYGEQIKQVNKRNGKELPSRTLAAGLPFNFSELLDKKGSYLGETFNGGTVMFDLFHKDSKRRYYNAALVGEMGAGKSTTLKKITKDNILRNNYVRGFDVVGEFETLISEFDGTYINLDGSQGRINPWQVLKTSADPKKSKEENEHQSFMMHLAKLEKFYRFLVPSATHDDIQEFNSTQRKFYEKIGLVDKIRQGGITELENDEYPISSEYLQFVREELYEDVDNATVRENLTPSRILRLEKIELHIENLVNSYGQMFDGHSTVQDITNEQIVFFSIRSLTQFSQEIFNAQIFNALNLLWDNMIQVGAPQMAALYENKDLDIDLIRKFLIIIDESHRFINPQNPLAVQYLTDYAREARKYFGGLLFASQSIRDYVPEGISDTVLTEIKKLFELTQYKFIMQQDSNTIKDMRKIFEGQLSESELNTIPILEQGECILSIKGVKNIAFKVDASPEEIQLFRGGL
jgi:DNA helicase HerA-like ATPase/uncharacterized protein (UPF0335 family)